jgi:hypothetical protein
MMDVILQKPFKHGFKQEFDVYTINNIRCERSQGCQVAISYVCIEIIALFMALPSMATCEST